MSERLSFSGVLQDRDGGFLVKVDATIHLSENRCVLRPAGSDDLNVLLEKGHILKGWERWRLWNGKVSEGELLEFSIKRESGGPARAG